MSKVLVTGAFGNLGQMVLDELRGQGFTPVAADLDSARSRRIAKRYGLGQTVHWDDIRRQDFDAVLSGVTAVIHLAAVLPPITEREPALARAINVEATMRLIDSMERAAPRAGLITLEQLSEVPLVAIQSNEVRKAYPDLPERRIVHETVRRMINTLVTDLIKQSERNISEQGVATIEDVRRAPAMIAYSAAMDEQQIELKNFLRIHLYRHYRVLRMSAKAQRIIGDLFGVFMADSRLLPPQFQSLAEPDRARAVADYIAGP